MKGLFWRIFLTFWTITVLTLVIGTTYIFMSEQTPPQMRLQEIRDIKVAEMERALSLYGQSIAAARTQGQEIQRLQQQYAAIYQFELLHSSYDGIPLSLIPGTARELVERSRETGRPEWAQQREKLWVALPERAELPAVVALTYLPDNAITLVGSLKAFLPLLIRRLPVEGTISLIACWFLAWQFTRPIRQLREATHKLAAGDWQTRVVPAVGGRNDEIGALARDFDQMAQELSDSSFAQQRLFRDISHELRSPLARLNIALELAKQNSVYEQQMPLERIEVEADRINELIGELLKLSQMEREAEVLDHEPMELDAVVRRVVDDGRFEAQRRGQGVCLQECDAVTLCGVATLMHRALDNVVRNAIRYSRQGTDVEVSLTSTEQGIRITVRDYGPGVPEGELEHIFRAFYRVGTARDRKSGGYGVGLALAQRVIQLHGGQIHARNADGGGLEIVIDLPPKEGVLVSA